ncbi:MAG: hypothetical protein WC471_02960 [Candidatus Woesearchaeota archaeon]
MAIPDIQLNMPPQDPPHGTLEELVLSIIGNKPISFDDVAKKLGGAIFMSPEGPISGQDAIHILLSQGQLVIDFTTNMIRPPTPEEKAKLEPLFAEAERLASEMEKVQEKIGEICMIGKSKS